jgi:Flp pilus assembly protein TadD
MMPARRRGLLLAVLTATVLFCGACTEPTIHTTSEISGSGISGPEVAGTEVAGPEMTRSAQPDPQQSKSYLSQGNRFLASREPDLAMKAFLGSMSVDGISAEAMTGAGIAAQQLGLLKAARRYLTQASELDPGSVAAHNNLGVVLYKMKEYYTARNEFRSAFAISSGKSEMAALNLNRAEATIASIEEIP